MQGKESQAVEQRQLDGGLQLQPEQGQDLLQTVHTLLGVAQVGQGVQVAQKTGLPAGQAGGPVLVAGEEQEVFLMAGWTLLVSDSIL